MFLLQLQLDPVHLDSQGVNHVLPISQDDLLQFLKSPHPVDLSEYLLHVHRGQVGPGYFPSVKIDLCFELKLVRVDLGRFDVINAPET